MIRENEGIFFFFLKYDDAFVVRGGGSSWGDYPASSQDTTLEN